jgi:hypothetical protein
MGVAVYRALDNGNGPDSFDCTDGIQIMNAWNPHPKATRLRYLKLLDMQMKFCVTRFGVGINFVSKCCTTLK